MSFVSLYLLIGVNIVIQNICICLSDPAPVPSYKGKIHTTCCVYTSGIYLQNTLNAKIKKS